MPGRCVLVTQGRFTRFCHCARIIRAVEPVKQLARSAVGADRASASSYPSDVYPTREGLRYIRRALRLRSKYAGGRTIVSQHCPIPCILHYALLPGLRSQPLLRLLTIEAKCCIAISKSSHLLHIPCPPHTRGSLTSQQCRGRGSTGSPSAACQKRSHHQAGILLACGNHA